MRNKPSARQLEAAAEIARTSPMPLDRLPYTEDFDSLHQQLCESVGPMTAAHAWQCLISARKHGLVGSQRKERKG